MNLANLDHPLASRPVDLVGEDVAIGGTTFRLRALSLRNMDFVIFRAEHMDDFSREAALAPLLPELLARACVMGWDRVSAEGIPVPFSADAVLKLFTLHPLLARAVFEEAAALGQSGGREGVAVADAKKPPHGGETTAASSVTSSAPPARASRSQH